MAIPSAFGPNRSSNQFGAGSLSGGLSNLISSSGGLGNTLATPVGRSSFDPQRQAEQAMRQARRAMGQANAAGDYSSAFKIGALSTNLAQSAQQFGQEQQGWQKVGEMFNKMTGQQAPVTQMQGLVSGMPMAQKPSDTSGITKADVTQAGWANQFIGGNTGSREQNVQAALQDPTKFAAIQSRYNAMAKNAGKMMDAQGNIVNIPG